MVGRLLLCFWFASLTATVRMALQEKYTIVNKSNQLIHLSCDASPDQLRAGIHWRLDGVPLAKNARNNILDLEVTDRPDAGKYSCHLNNTTELLKHYYVLIDEGSQADKILKEDNGNYITCQVEKFGGNFTCFWSMKENATFSASFHREGWKGVSNDCVLTLRKSSERDVQATCIDQTFSPYAEEFRQITFTVEAATSKRYEKHTKHFYIRDILKPTAPVNLTTQHVVKERKFNVTWQYPISWNHPHSYFPLLFKVDIKLTSRKGKHERQTGNVDTSAESLIPCNAAAIRQLKRHQTVSCYTESPSVEFSYKRKLFHKVGRVCVQVKELYFKSTWSQPSCTDH